MGERGCEGGVSPTDLPFARRARSAGRGQRALGRATPTKAAGFCPKRTTQRAEGRAEAALSPRSKEAAPTQHEAQTATTEIGGEVSAVKQDPNSFIL